MPGFTAPDTPDDSGRGAIINANIGTKLERPSRFVLS
jgi:hypothetical protein